MTTYTKITDYAPKDALITGNPSKIIKGTELGAEFDSIAAADADNQKKSSLGTNVAAFLATPSSANLAAALTDETGTGAAVFATSPTLVTPTLGDATANSLNGGQLAGFRNRIINGDMRIAQRGTSNNPTGTAFSVPSIDRMGVYASGSTGQFTFSQQAVSGVSGLTTCARLSRSASAEIIGRIYQVLESKDSLPLAGQAVTFSFWARCSAGFTPASSQITAYIISGTGTDQSGSSLSTGAWTTQTNVASGAKTLTTSWQQFSMTGTVGASATQVAVALMATFVGTASDYFETTGWQLEVGSVATPFEQRPIGTELQLCRRYVRVSAYQVPATTAQNLGTIDMRGVPTITGGGAGFTSTPTTADTLIAYQTSGSLQTLTLSAEL
jgi:hypothetical protein